MDINHIVIDTNKTVGNTTILVGVTPAFEYVDGVRKDNIVGYKYELVLPDRLYEKLVVKILGKKRVELADDGVPQPVALDGLTMSLYWTPQGHKVSATADNIKLISPPKRVG